MISLARQQTGAAFHQLVAEAHKRYEKLKYPLGITQQKCFSLHSLYTGFSKAKWYIKYLDE